MGDAEMTNAQTLDEMGNVQAGQASSRVKNSTTSKTNISAQLDPTNNIYVTTHPSSTGPNKFQHEYKPGAIVCFGSLHDRNNKVVKPFQALLIGRGAGPHKHLYLAKDLASDKRWILFGYIKMLPASHKDHMLPQDRCGMFGKHMIDFARLERDDTVNVQSIERGFRLF
jgi:hypothetical protein